MRDGTVTVGHRLVVQKEVLHDVRFVAKAQNEVPMSILAVILHDVPKDRLMADRYHRLRNALGILAYPRSKSSTEQNNLHGAKSFRLKTSTSRIIITILQPQFEARRRLRRFRSLTSTA